MAQFIDLSTPISTSPEGVPPFFRTEIEYSDHQGGAAHIQSMLNVPAHLLRDEEGWAVETIRQLGTHNSTHVDAPWHYNSLIQGEPAQTIDELPLEWFFNDAVVLDMTHKADGEVVTPEDAQSALEKIEVVLKPLDIVLIRTGCDKYYGNSDYMFRGCGVSAEATHWFFDQGIRVMGIDAWGWDKPLNMQAEEALKAQEKGIFWSAHQADLPYSQIERLMNLDQLPSHGFKVACFPLKIVRGSAAPARVVAIV